MPATEPSKDVKDNTYRQASPVDCSEPVSLFADETLEDLQRSGFRLIQPADGFRFGEDSVLLAAFAAELCRGRKQRSLVADLGAGSGSIGILMAARCPELRFVEVETDTHRFDCLKRNLRLNQLADRIIPVKADLNLLTDEGVKASAWPYPLQPSACDLVVINPPYRTPAGNSRRRYEAADSRLKSSMIASEELSINLDGLMLASGRLLKPGGILAMIHRPARLPDLIEAMRRSKIEPITLRPLESLPGREPSRIIIAGRKHGKSGGFRWLKPLVVCEKPGRFTPETSQMYGHEAPLSEAALYQGIIRIEEDWMQQ